MGSAGLWVGLLGFVHGFFFFSFIYQGGHFNRLGKD
jgi:hypothetical protein